MNDLPSRFQLNDEVACRGKRWTVECVGFWNIGKIYYTLRDKAGHTITVPSEQVSPTPVAVA